MTSMPELHLNPDEIAESVADLVRTPSVNPLHDPASSERALAEHVAARCRDLGADEVVLDPVFDGNDSERLNVYALFGGTSDRTVALDAHLDTVSVAHMTDPPFDGRVEDGAVWGRGALDTKASMGVMLAVLAAAKRAGVRPDANVWVVGTVGEEAGGLIGAGRFEEWVTERGIEIDEMIVAEPTEFRPIHGHKGGVTLSITTHGTAAHSAVPHLGENAIDAMVPVMQAYIDEHKRLLDEPATTELGPGTLTVATVHGGAAANIVPDSCTLQVSRRVVVGEDADEVYAGLAEIARNASTLPTDIAPQRPPGLEASGFNAFYIPADDAFVQRLAGWAGTTATVAPFGTNAMRYSGVARSAAVFGPGSIDQAHLATEHVDISDLVNLASIYQRWLF